MIKSEILEIIKNRERAYVESTERAIELFLPTLKAGLEKALFQSKNIEMYILDVSIVPQNFRFLRIDGKIITVNVGEKMKLEDEVIEVDLENIWDFAKPLSVIIPASLLDEGDENAIADYFIKVRENDDKIPNSIMSDSNAPEVKDTNVTEFEKSDKNLDEVQLMALKYFKSPSIH